MQAVLIGYTKNHGHNVRCIKDVVKIEHVKLDVCKAILKDGREIHFHTRGLVDIQLIRDEQEGMHNV